MTHSPIGASPARANLHRLDEPMNPMTSDTLGVEDLIERLKANDADITWALSGDDLPPRYRVYFNATRELLLEAASALLPKGVDRGGREEEGVPQSQPGYDASMGASAGAEPSGALEPFLRAFDNYRHDGTVLWLCGVDRFGRFFGIQDVSTQLAALSAQAALPIPMILFCPACGLQHIDAPNADAHAHSDGRESRWDNPPHRSHLCHGCGHIWRPADVATEGVAFIQTRGKADSAATASPLSDDVSQDAPILTSNGHSDAEPSEERARLAELAMNLRGLSAGFALAATYGEFSQPEVTLSGDLLAVLLPVNALGAGSAIQKWMERALGAATGPAIGSSQALDEPSLSTPHLPTGEAE